MPQHHLTFNWEKYQGVFVAATDRLACFKCLLEHKTISEVWKNICVEARIYFSKTSSLKDTNQDPQWSDKSLSLVER